MTERAVHSFTFIGCVELRQTLDYRARDERELLDRLDEVPAESIFYHTHGYFLRHRPVTTAYGTRTTSMVWRTVRTARGSPRPAETTRSPSGIQSLVGESGVAHIPAGQIA